MDCFPLFFFSGKKLNIDCRTQANNSKVVFVTRDIGSSSIQLFQIHGGLFFNSNELLTFCFLNKKQVENVIINCSPKCCKCIT